MQTRAPVCLMEHFVISVYWHGFENSCHVTNMLCGNC